MAAAPRQLVVSHDQVPVAQPSISYSGMIIRGHRVSAYCLRDSQHPLRALITAASETLIVHPGSRYSLSASSGHLTEMTGDVYSSLSSYVLLRLQYS